MASPYGVASRHAIVNVNRRTTGTASIRRGRACATRGLAMASPYAIGQCQPKMALDPRPPVGVAHARLANRQVE